MEANTVSVNLTSNGTVVIPKGYGIAFVTVQENAGNAVTGGIKIGTSSGAVDVVIALAVAGSSLQAVLDATLLKRVFSLASDTTLFIQTVTLWNSANVTFYFTLYRLVQ